MRSGKLHVKRVNAEGADSHPEKVAELRERIELAREAVPPLIVTEAFGALKPVLFGAVVFPDEEAVLEEQP